MTRQYPSTMHAHYGGLCWVNCNSNITEWLKWLPNLPLKIKCLTWDWHNPPQTQSTPKTNFHNNEWTLPMKWGLLCSTVHSNPLKACLRHSVVSAVHFDTPVPEWSTVTGLWHEHYSTSSFACVDTKCSYWFIILQHNTGTCFVNKIIISVQTIENFLLNFLWLFLVDMFYTILILNTQCSSIVSLFTYNTNVTSREPKQNYWKYSLTKPHL